MRAEAALEQRERLWKLLQRDAASSVTTAESGGNERVYPDYTTVLSDVQSSDYSEMLSSRLDARDVDSSDGAAPVKRVKTLCPHGAVAKCRIEWFPETRLRYTGLFSGADAGIVRLSTAMKPPAAGVTSFLGRAFLLALGTKLRNSQLFPCVAVKVFRGSGKPSGNLLFGGCKTGQGERNFFAHCLCTNMTERVSPALRFIVSIFKRYSDHPLSLGISDFASVTEAGDDVEDPVFPYCLVLSPVKNLSASSRHSKGAGAENPTQNDVPFDAFLDDLLSLPSGTPLWDIFACPEPRDAIDASKLERLGQLVTTSQFESSGPGDRLNFKHQAKEEDLALRPEWAEQLQIPCSPDGSEPAAGCTVGRLAGWELFERLIGMGLFQDYHAEHLQGALQYS